MTTAVIPDLWPVDLARASAEPAPAVILRQQGHLLGQRTGNFVYGEVISEQDGGGVAEVRPNEFLHSFYIASAYLKYRRRIAFVRHALDPYPATFVELAVDNSGANLRTAPVHNSTELANELRTTFARDEVRRVIQSLVAQTRDLDD